MNPSLTLRIASGFTVVLLLMGLLTWNAVQQQTTSIENLNELINVEVEKQKLAARMVQNLIALQRDEKNLILETDHAAMEAFEQALLNTETELEQRYRSLEKLADNAEKKTLEKFYLIYQHLLSAQKQIISYTRGNANDIARELSFSKTRALSLQSQTLLAELVDNIDAELDKNLRKRTAQQQQAIQNMLVIGLVALVVTLLAAISIVRYQKRRIDRLSNKAGQIARGYLPDMGSEITDELSAVEKALDDITQNLREVISYSSFYSNGDFSKRLKPRSQHDSLVDTINQMADSSLEVIRQAKVIANGDYRTDFSPRSGEDELGLALQQMTASLRRFEEETQNRAWIDSGIALISKTALAANNESILAESLLSTLCQYTGATLGAFYTRQAYQQDHSAETKPSLLRAASYALSQNDSERLHLHWGESLAGQAAADNSMIEVHEVPDDYFRINSSLGDSLPRHLIVMPFSYQNNVLGVIELASLTQLDENSKTLLERSMVAIGIAVESARRNTELAISLQNAQTLTEELQQQQEELEENNQQLEEQTTQLEKQAEEIEVSRNELEARNEQLQSAQLELTQRAKELEL